MTNVQKTIYKALYEKNKDMLIKGLATNNPCNTNLNNLEIQLRKCCNHPFLIKELEFDLLRNCHSIEERMDKLLSSSGKMVLVKKLL
jgi:chromodomain-helicase-DNA-binding protein 7